jgi:hypothetical protein
MSSPIQCYTTPKTKNNICDCTTIKNKKCKNKASENGKCTFHNNRINKIINSNVCRKLKFDTCNGYNFIRQEEINGIYKNILNKCDEDSIININNNFYCEHHCKNYKYEIPEDCSICNEEIIYEEEVPLSCGHWFHLNCLKQCNKMECPLCRTFYKDDEIKMIYNLITMSFKEIKNDIINDFELKIPKKIIIDEQLGISFILLLYMEITKLYQMLNLEYDSTLINKILLNIFKNNEYLEISIKVYNLFDKIIENGITSGFEIKESINFDEDNEYTLNYDNFHYHLKTMYYSLM